MPKKKTKPSSATKSNTTKDSNSALRKHLLDLLNGGNAHAKFEDVVSDVPARVRGAKPENYPHTPWMLLEHLRIAQWDILEFSRNPKHKSPEWPSGYWPKAEAPPDALAWNNSIQEFEEDLKAMKDLVASSKTDLFARIPWGEGQTVLREALLVADHNAYHLGQIVDVLRLLAAWKQ
jgi:hypothetical protein